MNAPLPWRQSGNVVMSDDGAIVADCWTTPRIVARAADIRASQIVRAVNNHDALLTALHAARARLALVFGPDRDPRDDATVREIDAAIEKATS